MAELSTVARPYAEALFASVQKAGTGFEAWSEQLDELAGLVALDDVREAMSDPRLDDTQRIDVFTGLVKTPLTDAGRRFIALLVENGRIQALPEIALQFDQLRNRLEGTALADITSAYPIDDAQVQQLVGALETKFGLKLKPQVTVDPDLIGGVRVVVGDQVLDTSVRAQLQRMRDTLAA